MASRKDDYAMESLPQNGLTKVASHLFDDFEIDFWRDVLGDIHMTSEQIGRALDYSDPIKGTNNVFERNRIRLEPNSVVLKLRSTDGKSYDTRLFNEKGIYEIIRKSSQPKADQFYDWVYEVLQSIRKTGAYITKIPSDERSVRIELLKTTLEHEQRLGGIEERIATVERDMTLNYGEQRALQRAVGRRVYELESSPEMRRELFKQAHREIRDRWGVASYRDVRRIELQEVLNYVRAWKPRMQLVG